MNRKAIFWEDREPRSPRENLAINLACVEEIKCGRYDLIARVYRHTKGIILGNSESIEDINQEVCNQKGYEIVSRPSGGSAIIVNPDLTLCYSVFFDSKRFGGRFGMHEAYKAITIPLAKNLGNNFSVEGNYYIRYNNGLKKIPIAGHAIKSYGEIMQFDGVINNQRFNIREVSNLINLRDLYVLNGKKYLRVRGQFFDLAGNEIEIDSKRAKLIRSEAKELEEIVGLEDLGISQSDFISALKNALEGVFGKIDDKRLVFNSSKIKNYVKKVESLIETKNKRRNLGHCFVDFIEEEQKIHYSAN